MLKVNNKRTIHILTKSSFGANKLRNLFAIIAIVLTVILFTGLFTVASSLVASIEAGTMRQVGGSSHGSFKYLSQEEYGALKTHPSIKDISYSVVLGFGENQELKKHPTEIRYSSGDVNAKGMFSMPTTGALPQNDNEIATNTIVLECLGVPAEIGQKLTLSYTLAEKIYTDTFTLVGFWEGDKLMQASQIWLSKSYVEKQLASCPKDYDIGTIGTLNADVNFASSFRIEDKLQKVILESGYTLDEIDYGVNWAYAGNSGSLDAGTVISAVGAILMIVFCGYLMISNVFTIGIAKDVRYYGLIKAIGTTPKQIRRIIRKQALLLCGLGIPIGLIAGYLIGRLLVPVVMSIMYTDVVKTSASPLIFILATLFSAFTVIISISKPSKIAAKVSPIEALRSIDSSGGKRKYKRGARADVGSMARNNIGRNKKKAILVTVSLSLGLIILNATYSIANGFDMDKYLSRMIGNDYKVGDVTNFNVNLNYSNEDSLNEVFFLQLSQQEGIEGINKIYFTEPLVSPEPDFMQIPSKEAVEYKTSEDRVNALEDYAGSDSIPLHIYGLEEGTMGQLTVLQGECDKDKLNSGKYVIAAPYDESGKIQYYELGDIVVIPNSDGGVQEYEVLAIALLPENISCTHSHPLTPSVYIPSEVFINQVEDKAPMFVTIDVSDESIAGMELFLTEYCSNVDQNMDFISKSTLADEYQGLQNTIKTVGITLSTLIALIGVMNFINTVITSIIARKLELAMLQSIGMTNRQVMYMLIQESTLYIFFAFSMLLTVGSGLCYLGIRAFIANQDFMKFYFTVVPSLLCLPTLLLIAVVVPVISLKSICKSSVVERLREVG